MRGWDEIELASILDVLMDGTCDRGILEENSVVYRDLFDTELMGRLTSRPARTIGKFQTLSQEAPVKGHRPAGELDVTINPSESEKDPKAIATAWNLPASNFHAVHCAQRMRVIPDASEPSNRSHYHAQRPTCLKRARLPLSAAQKSLKTLF